MVALEYLFPLGTGWMEERALFLLLVNGPAEAKAPSCITLSHGGGHF